MAKLYYRTGKIKKADKILLELINFAEKMWNMPDGAVLTYRSPFLENIEGKVARRELNGKVYVEALHDSYFYPEN